MAWLDPAIPRLAHSTPALLDAAFQASRIEIEITPTDLDFIVLFFHCHHSSIGGWAGLLGRRRQS